MIVCKNCEFEVNTSMRHSLMKNCCPSCGSALLGDLHSRRLNLMKQRILEQEFSQELNNELIFDLSLFIMSEFFPVNTEVTSEEEAVSDDESLVAVEEFKEESYDNIREEIRNEALTDIEDALESADEDLKVARLKRIAKESQVKNSGPTVRRVSD
jgi:Zn-finger nucleic acid-binding protein